MNSVACASALPGQVVSVRNNRDGERPGSYSPGAVCNDGNSIPGMASGGAVSIATGAAALGNSEVR